MPEKAVKITSTDAAPRTLTFGHGAKRVKIRPGKATILDMDDATELEADEHFRRSFHNGELKIELVEEKPGFQPVELGPDNFKPAPVLSRVNDVGVFLGEKSAPTPYDQLSDAEKKTHDIAAARGITVEQLVAQRTENARRQAALAAANKAGKSTTSKPVAGPKDD